MPQQPLAQETFWAHLEIVGTVLIPVALAWWDNRRRQKDHWAEMVKTSEEAFRENELRNNARHIENVDRLARIETSLEPIATWFNNGRTIKGG